MHASGWLSIMWLPGAAGALRLPQALAMSMQVGMHVKDFRHAWSQRYYTGSAACCSLSIRERVLDLLISHAISMCMCFASWRRGRRCHGCQAATMVLISQHDP